MRNIAKPKKPTYPYVLNADSDQAQGLVGWWPGGPLGGPRLFDMSGRGNHGTINGTIPATGVWVPGYQGGKGALAFDGSTNYISLPNNPILNLTGPNSLLAFINTTNTGVNMIFGGYNPGGSFNGFGLAIGVTGAGVLNFWSGTDGMWRADSSGITLNDGKTHLVGVSFPGDGGLYFYIDGLQRSSIASSMGNSYVSGKTIGATDGGGSNFFNGKIEEPRIYSRGLGKAEHNNIYTKPWDLRYQVGRVKYFTGANVSNPDAVFDAASNSGYQSPASSYSWSHTCTGSNRFLAVDISLLSVPGTTVTAVTYNGMGMSLIGARSSLAGANRVENWGLVAPANGTNTIAVTLSASVASVGTAVSYANVNQTTPTESYNSAQATNTGSATNASVVITPVSDETIVHAAVATTAASITATQTGRNNVSGLLGSGADQDTALITPASAQTMAYSGEGITDTWVVGGYAILSTPDSNVFTKYFTGTLTETGLLTKADAKPMAGTLAATSALVRMCGKPLTGGLTENGAAIVKACGKAITGGLTGTGGIVKAAAKGLTGAMAETGVIAKAVAKPMTGTLHEAGVLMPLKTKLTTFTGTLTATAVFIKAVNKVLAGQLAETGTLRKAIAKHLAATQAQTGVLAKLTRRAMSGALTCLGALTNLFIAGSGPVAPPKPPKVIDRINLRATQTDRINLKTQTDNMNFFQGD